VQVVPVIRLRIQDAAVDTRAYTPKQKYSMCHRFVASKFYIASTIKVSRLCIISLSLFDCSFSDRAVLSLEIIVRRVFVFVLNKGDLLCDQPWNQRKIFKKFFSIW
jgi:hypothetical protein